MVKLPTHSTLDARVFPATADYIASLPAGLNSYPKHVVKAAVLSPTLRVLRAHTPVQRLPGPLGDLVRGELRQPWVPDVLGCAAMLLRRDLLHHDDASYIDAMRDTALATLSTPLYTALRLVMSPSLLLSGAGNRWNALRRGTSITVQASRRHGDRYVATGRLIFPPGLYNEVLLEVFVQWLTAVLRLSRVRDLSITRLDSAATSATARVCWRTGAQRAA